MLSRHRSDIFMKGATPARDPFLGAHSVALADVALAGETDRKCIGFLKSSKKSTTIKKNNH